MRRNPERDERLERSLRKAHITLRSDVYLSHVVLNIFCISGVAAVLVLAAAAMTAAGVVAIPPVAFTFLAPLPFAVAFIIYVLAYLLPDLKASARAREIDARLPYALNYITIMASAGVTPQRIFGSLAEQEIYGEVANEAAWISRDIDLLGHDLLSALSRAVDRSPSTKFQDFLQGALTALASGEDLKLYFHAKSLQFVQENRHDQKRFLDLVGVLAESYVTIVVAAPLLIIVMLTVMLMFGGNIDQMFFLGYLIVLFLLPMAMLVFGTTLRVVTPKV